MRLFLVPLLIVGCVGSAKADEDHSFWWYAKAKVACLPDVLRFCKGDMPNEDKVRSCMAGKRAFVSASCAEFYPGGKNAD